MLAGLQRTGRVTIGPGADLVELISESDLKHTAIVFHPELREHPALAGALEPIKGFLEAPYVTGISELVGHDSAEGAFVYPTGDAWSIYDIVRTWSDMGETPGVRAGLELMYAAGSVLLEAAEAGEHQGVYSHGGITPWRVMIKPDGQVEIIGYALPQVEILRFQENPKQVPKEDSFRYCPPERLEGTREDLSADLFCLSLVAFEMMTGRPVYDGLVNDIRTQAARGEGRRRLFRFKDLLPTSVRELLTVALRATPGDRFEDGEAFLEGVRIVLGSPEAEGPPLVDVMQRLQALGPRHRTEELAAGKTAAMSMDQIKDLLGEDLQDIRQEREARKAARASEPAEQRARSWSPAAPRGARPAAPEPAAAAPEPAPRARPEPARPAPRAPEPAPMPAATPAHVPPTPSPRASAGRATPDPLRESSAGRWSRPDPGRRRRRVRGDDTPEPEEVAGTASGAESAGGKANAEDLLARLRASRSATAGAGGLGVGRRSASDVISKILSNSGGGATRAPEPAAPEPAFGVRRPPTRGGGGGLVDAIRADADVPLPREPARAAPTPVAAPPVATPVVPAKPTTQVRPRRPIAEEEAPAPTPTPAPAVAARPAAQPVERPGEFRAPDAIRGLSAGTRQQMFIRRGPGGSPLKARLSTEATLAEAVFILTGTVLPIRADLSGRVALGYRLGPDEGPASGTTLVGSYAEKTVLTLHPVLCRDRWATFVVETDDGSVRMRSPVASTLSVASVVDFLCLLYQLDPGHWKLHASGEVLCPFLLVEELDLTQPLVLQR